MWEQGGRCSVRPQLSENLVNVFTTAIALLSIEVMFSGCGYTILDVREKKSAPCPQNREANLPDLSIDNVSATMQQVLGQTVEHFTEDITTFLITIRNVGSAPFKGSILINFADNAFDIKSKRYPLHGEVQSLTLQVGDSSFVRVERQARWYRPGTQLVFVLRTDTYPPHTFDPIYYFAREPVCEVSYENNAADFIVP